MTGSAAGPDSHSTRVEHDPREHIYTFDRPPVSEVVCSIAFQSPPNFTAAEIGRYWARIAADFPSAEAGAPILFPGVPFPIQLTQTPRFLFRHSDGTKIIQVQDTGFHYNWVRTKGGEHYPRYSAVYAGFASAFADFQSYLNDRRMGQVTPLQYKLSYVNHIRKPEGWVTPDEVRNFMPDFFANWPAHTYVGRPSVIAIQFVTEVSPGRLDVSIRNGPTREDAEQTLVFELSVSSQISPMELASMKRWFDSAREVIVRSFKDLTSADAHRKWGLHAGA